MGAHQNNLTSSSSGPLQVIDHAFAGLAPTWSPMGLASINDDLSPWDTGFELAASASLFAYDSVFGASPPNTDTDTSSSYLLQSPPSTVSSDQQITFKGDTSPIDDHTALTELSKINIDLHARVSAAKSNCSRLTFDDLVYRQGPLYIDNCTLAEFVLNISESFLQTISRVLSSRVGSDFLPASSIVGTRISELPSPNHKSRPQPTCQVNQPPHSSPPYHDVPPEPLSTPLALTITSIFIQILSLYELILEHTTTRVDRLPIEPIPPIPILPYDSLVLKSLCSQGAFFSGTAAHVLEKMQYVLGIEAGRGAGQKGLLTAKQVKILWIELDSGRAIVPGQTLMGPAILQRLFGKMENVLERLAADTGGS